MTADTQNKDHKNTPIELSVEQIAYSVQVTRAALDHGTDELSYEVSERLRAIRVRALAQAKQNAQQPAQEKTNAVTEILNWRDKLAGWLKAGVAVSAFGLALVISVVSIRSELTTAVAVSDRAISMTESSATSTANTQNAQAISSPESTHALVDSANTATLHSATAPHQHRRNTNINTSAKGNTSTTAVIATAELAYQAPVPALAGANSANGAASVDDEIALVLHEQIPLQAYLNDDFARFANHQGLSTIEKLSNTNSSASPEQ